MSKKLLLIILIVFIGLGVIFIGKFRAQTKQAEETQSVVEQKTIDSNDTIFDDSNIIKKMVGLGFTINHKNIGDDIDLQRILLKVNGVKENTTFFDVLGNREYQAKKGAKFVFVNVSITNQETASFYMPIDAFTVIDNLKREYGEYHDTYVYKLANSIDDNLQPGIEQIGVIVFKLPESSESYALLTSYEDGKEAYLITLINNN